MGASRTSSSERFDNHGGQAGEPLQSELGNGCRAHMDSSEWILCKDVPEIGGERGKAQLAARLCCPTRPKSKRGKKKRTTTVHNGRFCPVAPNLTP